MNKDLTEFAINYAREKGATYSEARYEEVKGSGFVLKNGVPQISGFDTTKGLGIRLIVNNTLGFLAVNEFSKSKIKKQIEKTIKITRASSRIGEKIKFADNKSNKESYEVKQKVKIDDLSPTEKLDFIQQADNAILDSKIKTPGRYIHLGDSIIEKYYCDSDGSRIYSKIPYVDVMYFLTVKQNNKTSQRYWQLGNTGGYEWVKKWNLPKVCKEEVNILSTILKKGKRSPTGKMDIVIGPEISGIAAHEACGHPYEADRILGREGAQAGESFITIDMMNTQLGAEGVDVIENPTIPNSYGYMKYDDEGVKAKKRYLMKDGKINDFLHNRQTAEIFKRKSNGSSRASSYDVEPLIRMSNTYIAPGDQTEDEIISGVKNGVYMKSFTEWNIDDKRYQQKYVGNESYVIKNGKIGEPIVDPILEITTPKLYSSIDAMGKNLELHPASCGKGERIQAIPVTIGGPSIRLKNIYIK